MNITTGDTIFITSDDYTINKELYEADLKRRQQEHLMRINQGKNSNWRPCLHDGCPECIGTGIKFDGSPCIHYISCPCPKCTPSF